MEKIKNLNYYQKGVLIFMIVMTIAFFPIYFMTISRVGFEYKDTIFVPTQENGITVYSAKMNGQQSYFTLSENKTVMFQYGSKTFGPYVVKEDPTAIPQENESAESMIGIELLKEDTVLFRGGVLKFTDAYWLYNEDGTVNFDITFSTLDGIARDENGNPIDPVEPSATNILNLMNNPQLTHKGEWFAWFGAALICVVNALSILFADELFRFNLIFQIRNVDSAEPSDWEIAGRYISWTLLSIMALVIFIMGLQ